MVPTAFVPLATLPMTPNGKVDRRVLPTPTDQPMVVDAYAPPRSVMQEALADIWVDLLGLDRIGIHDDFFELGGHSLLAAQVISRLHTDLGIQVPVQTIFAAPTIADLAERIERERQDAPAVDGASASTSLMVLRTGRSGSPVFFVPGGVGEVANLFKIAQLARQAQGQEPFYGFLREGFEAFDERNPQVRVETVAAHFVAELRACQADGPYVLGGVCSGGTIALEMARQLRAQGQEVRLLLLFDAWRPGNQGDRASERLRSLLGEIRERRIQRNAALGAEAAVPAEADERSMTPETAEAPGTIGPRAAVVRPAFEDAPTIGGSAPAPGEDLLADGRAVYGYRPDSYPGRVVLFVNEEWHRLDPTLGWDSIVAGGLDVHVIPGSHRTYLLHHLGLVAAQLRTHLDQLRPTALVDNAQRSVRQHGSLRNSSAVSPNRPESAAPQPRLELTHDGLHVWCVSLRRPGSLLGLSQMLSPDERARADRFRSPATATASSPPAGCSGRSWPGACTVARPTSASPTVPSASRSWPMRPEHRSGSMSPTLATGRSTQSRGGVRWESTSRQSEPTWRSRSWRRWC
jgi:thioesterase domain-containing protein/acyl carrier protein